MQKVMTDNCIFCNLPNERILYESVHWFVISDSYPVSPGHTLLIPKRHIKDYFDINDSEYAELKTVLDLTKARLDKEFNPGGYNIGINCGEDAGQTVFHLHMHVIPRFKGDQADPRGGVRCVIPEKADYWTKP